MTRITKNNKITNEEWLVITNSLNLENIEIQNETTKNSFLIIEKEGEKEYLMYSASYFNENATTGRNSYLVQRFIPVLTEIFNLEFNGMDIKEIQKENILNLFKKIKIFLFNSSSTTFCSYQLYVYRCFLTLGIDIVNKNELFIEEKKDAVPTPFNCISDFKNLREKNNKNGNNSSNLKTDENIIGIETKTEGANLIDGVLLVLTTYFLTKNKIKVFPKEEDKETKLEIKNKQKIKDKKEVRKISPLIQNIFNILDIELSEEIRVSDIKLKDRKTLRDQPTFVKNLKKSYEGDCSCYLCKKLKNTIASHIIPVWKTDRSILSTQDKIKLNGSGDNGIWLCGNHDKQFELGYFSFSNEGEVIFKNTLEETEQKELKETIKVLKIKEKYLTKERRENLTEHRKIHGFTKNNTLILK